MEGNNLDYGFKVEMADHTEEIPLEKESLDYDFKVEIPEVSLIQQKTGRKVQGKWVTVTNLPKCEKCNKCEAVFHSRQELMTHMKSSHKKCFICQDCNKRFKSQTNLDDHVYMIHLKIKGPSMDFFLVQHPLVSLQHILGVNLNWCPAPVTAH